MPCYESWEALKLGPNRRGYNLESPNRRSSILGAHIACETFFLNFMVDSKIGSQSRSGCISSSIPAFAQYNIRR